MTPRRYKRCVLPTLGALLVALLLAGGESVAADARSAVEAYVARIAGSSIDDLTVEQTFTLYHPDGRHPASTGSQRLFLRIPRRQRIEQTLDGRREVRLTVGDRTWVRQPDGKTYEAPPPDPARERVHLLTAFPRGATDLLAEWRSLGVRDDVTDETRAGGRTVTIIGAKAANRDHPAVWLDPEYGVVRVITREGLPQGAALVDITYSDHRSLAGRFFYPYRQEVFVDGKLLVLVAVRSVAANVRLSDDLFDPEILKRRE